MKRVEVSSAPLLPLVVNLNINDNGSKHKIKDEVSESEREPGNGDLGNSESETSLPELPEEIWLHIFTLVKNSKDLQNITLASPTFSHYLQEQKSTFLFKQILPILCRKHENDFDEKTLLLLRKTCKTWRHSIDTFLECESQRKPFEVSEPQENSNWTYDPKTLKLKTFTFTNPWNIRKLLDFFKEIENGDHHHGNTNPFVGRCVDLNIYFITPNHPLNVGFDLDLSLDSFFSQFGHHLWHVTIYDESELPLTAIQFYARFRTLLDQLPSIRSLDLTVTRLIPEVDHPRVRRRGRLELKRYMDEHPLAAIPVPFLEALEVNPGVHGAHESYAYEVPQHFLSDDNEDYASEDNPEDDTELGPCNFLIQRNILEAYGNQLKKVCMDWSAWIGWQMGIPNVTELRFKNIFSNQDLSSLVEKLTASYAQGPKFPKLAKLDLEFKYSRVDADALMKLFRCLKKNSKLRVVKLELFHDCVVERVEGRVLYEEILLQKMDWPQVDFLIEEDDLSLEGLEGKIGSWLSVVRGID